MADSDKEEGGWLPIRGSWVVLPFLMVPDGFSRSNLGDSIERRRSNGHLAVIRTILIIKDVHRSLVQMWYTVDSSCQYYTP